MGSDINVMPEGSREQNVFLNISITNDGWNIQLMPFSYEEEDDECED